MAVGARHIFKSTTYDHVIMLRYRMLQSAIAIRCILRASSFTFDSRRQATRASTCLSALTERQMQFWEDVDDGLVDVEQVYAAKGQDIDRIRTFGKR